MAYIIALICLLLVFFKYSLFFLSFGPTIKRSGHIVQDLIMNFIAEHVTFKAFCATPTFFLRKIRA